MSSTVTNYGGFVGAQPDTFCQNPSVDGFVMTSGTLSTSLGAGLCDTKMYINAGDCFSFDDNGYGPSWNTGDNDGNKCPFDDQASLGRLDRGRSAAGVYGKPSPRNPAQELQDRVHDVTTGQGDLLVLVVGVDDPDLEPEII